MRERTAEPAGAGAGGSASLLPERHLELQLLLDRMRKLDDECRAALHRLRRGELSRESFRELLDRQHSARCEWEACNRKLFAVED